MSKEILKNVPLFKCRASKGSVLNTGYVSATNKDLERITELKNEHDTLLNKNGNKVKWTESKSIELDALVYKSLNPQLGETAKNYLKEWVISQLTGHRKEIQSKYLTKGIAVEDAALVRASKYYGVEFTKNTERKEDDYFTGEWDSIGGDRVIDVKSSWDAFTFPYFDEQPNKGYYEQLQVYMALTGLKKASLVYCLENATFDEIERRAWSIAKGLDFEEPEIEHWEKAESEMTYDHLPDWMRIKVYEFERNDELIEQMQQRVIEARGYILAAVVPSLEKMIINFNNK